MKRESPERIVHLAVLEYLRTVLFGNPVIHHSPNEFGMSGADIARQIAKHKHMGMAVGFPDLVAFTFHGPLFFEVKSESGSVQNSQREMHDNLRRLNYRVAVVRGVDDVREWLAAWKIPTRETHKDGEMIP